MPTIPTAARLGRDVPQGRSRVISTYDPSTAKALSNVGSALQGLSEAEYRRQQIERQEAFTSATLDFGIDLERSQRDFERDPDYATHDARFMTGANKRLGELATGITDPDDQAEFVRRGRLQIERARTMIGRNAFNLERSDKRGQIDGQLESSRNAAVMSDPGSVGDFSATVKVRLDAAVDAGYYSAEEADQLYRDWQSSVAVGRVRMVPPEQQMDLLDNPYIRDNLPPDELAALKRESEKALVVHKAVATVDVLLAQPDITFMSGREQIAAIEDKRERLAAERRFEAEYAKKLEAEAEWVAARSVEIQNHIALGGTLEDLPPDMMDNYQRLTPMSKHSVRTLSRLGFAKSTSPAVTTWLHEMAHSPGDWDAKRRKLTEIAHLTSKSDYEKYMNLFVNKLSPEEPNLTAELKGVYPGSGNTERRDQILPLLQDEVNRYIERTERHPDSEWIRNQIRLFGADRGFWFKGDVYKLQDANEREAETRRIQLDWWKDQEPEVLKATRDYITASGGDPTRISLQDMQAIFEVEKEIHAWESSPRPEEAAAAEAASAKWREEKANNPTLSNLYHLQLIRDAITFTRTGGSP